MGYRAASRCLPLEQFLLAWIYELIVGCDGLIATSCPFCICRMLALVGSCRCHEKAQPSADWLSTLTTGTQSKPASWRPTAQNTHNECSPLGAADGGGRAEMHATPGTGG